MAIYLYIMHSEKLGDYYVGVSEFPEKRVKYNNMGQKEWSEPGIPWKLVFKKEYPDRPAAQKAATFVGRQDNPAYIEKLASGEASLE